MKAILDLVVSSSSSTFPIPLCQASLQIAVMLQLIFNQRFLHLIWFLRMSAMVNEVNPEKKSDNS
jgi:hypothetical protein